MNKLETIEALVSKIPCPICLNSRFQVNLNCELPKSPCDFHAVCGHCHYKFVVTQDTKTMEDIWTRLEKHIIEKGCPECGDHKLHLEFLCDVKSEDCFFWSDVETKIITAVSTKMKSDSFFNKIILTSGVATETVNNAT